MANPQFIITTTWRDSEGDLFSATAFSAAADYAGAVIEATQIAGDAQLLSLCTLAKLEVTTLLSSDGTVPSGGIDGEVKGLFTFNNADGKAYQISIPGFNPSLKNAGADTLNIAHPDVAGFIATMTGGTVVDSRNIDLVSLRSAVEQWTRRRRSS